MITPGIDGSCFHNSPVPPKQGDFYGGRPAYFGIVPNEFPNKIVARKAAKTQKIEREKMLRLKKSKAI